MASVMQRLLRAEDRTTVMPDHSPFPGPTPRGRRGAIEPSTGLPVAGSVDLDMPVERLWETFLDVSGWPRWNPCIWRRPRARGRTARGRHAVWVFNPIKPRYPYKLPARAEIVEFEPHDRVTWEVSAPGLPRAARLPLRRARRPGAPGSAPGRSPRARLTARPGASGWPTSATSAAIARRRRDARLSSGRRQRQRRAPDARPREARALVPRKPHGHHVVARQLDGQRSAGRSVGEPPAARAVDHRIHPASQPRAGPSRRRVRARSCGGRVSHERKGAPRPRGSRCSTAPSGPTRGLTAARRRPCRRFSSTQSLPAFSGSSLSPAIALATCSWSSLVSFIFLSTSYAGEPLSANFFENSLLMIVTSYAHLYCCGSPPALASSLQSSLASVLGGSLTSARSYSWLRNCGVYQ